jgi:agmatine/peptidylarginine deiminase
MQYTLLPEWAEQDAVMLTWPHLNTDWSEILDKVEPVYIALCQQISQVEDVVIIAHTESLKEHISSLLKNHEVELKKVHFVVTPYNDTWARDHGPITTINDEGKLSIKDFTFTGWGNKFSSDLDNKINKILVDELASPDNNYDVVDMVLEGGGIEINESGTLLTTTECLLNDNRNPELSKDDVEAILKGKLGVKDFLWVDHGYLAGDDTDSHIDTLVRFAPKNTLVYVGCDDESDEHYSALAKMADQLRSFQTSSGDAYKLIELPWPKAIFDDEGERLPATYANYLIINKTVLVPVYNDEKDALALKQIQLAYPEHTVIGIDCVPIIHQFGSLHCITMQLPKGFLKRIKHV